MKLKELLEVKKNGGSVVDALCDLEMSISGEDYTNLEANAVFEGAISYDGDLEEILINELNVTGMIFVDKNDKTYIHTSVPGIDKDDSFMFISDKETHVLVPMVLKENRHGDDLGDEIFVFFEKLVEVTKEVMDSCDICKKTMPRDILINIYPANNTGDIKDVYKDFDGMVCPDCYNNTLAKN